ncbi:MAG: NAD(P)/FAD-dependent oxidoreductase [Halobacteriaceae archaeon]
MADVAVVGGGIAGASVAWHLAERDVPVTVYERGALADETTRKSAAFVGLYGTETEVAMKRYALRRYNEVLAAPRAAPRHDLVGRLDLATTAAGRRRLRDRPTGPSPDPVAELDPADVPELLVAPALETAAVTAARWRPAVGYVRPRELAREFAARAEEAGATVRTDTTVEDVLVEAGHAEGVVVDGDPVGADAVVSAAGPWTPAVARMAGVSVPVRHTLAPVLRLDVDAPATLPILSHEESGVYLRGDERGVLVGVVPGGYDDATERDPGEVPEAVPAGLRETMLDAVTTLTPSLADAPVAEEWVGVRSHTPDGHPVAGETAVEDFAVVAFDSSGVQLSPAAADAVARDLTGASPPPWADAVSPGRF